MGDQGVLLLKDAEENFVSKETNDLISDVINQLVNCENNNFKDDICTDLYASNGLGDKVESNVTLQNEQMNQLCVENKSSNSAGDEGEAAAAVEVQVQLNSANVDLKTENSHLVDSSSQPVCLVPYRVNDDSSGSDLEEDSESDSSSDSSDSESSSNSSDMFSSSDDSISGECQSLSPKKQTPKTPSCKITKTKGELCLDDLPPIEDLKITVPEQDMVAIGTVGAIVDKLVIVNSSHGSAALDLDSFLFLQNGSPLGQVFDVLGPVVEPSYAIRFNSEEEIQSKEISIGTAVYYVPLREDLTSYVFVEQLRKIKGSDASWKNNNEPPAQFLEYSDDEEERKAKGKLKNKNFSNEKVNNQSKSGSKNQCASWLETERPKKWSSQAVKFQQRNSNSEEEQRKHFKIFPNSFSSQFSPRTLPPSSSSSSSRFSSQIPDRNQQLQMVEDLQNPQMSFQRINRVPPLHWPQFMPPRPPLPPPPPPPPLPPPPSLPPPPLFLSSSVPQGFSPASSSMNSNFPVSPSVHPFQSPPPPFFPPPLNPRFRAFFPGGQFPQNFFHSGANNFFTSPHQNDF